jgi:hypothetical protein
MQGKSGESTSTAGFSLRTLLPSRNDQNIKTTPHVACDDDVDPPIKTVQTAETAKRQEQSEAWSQDVARAWRWGCWTAGVAFLA